MLIKKSAFELSKAVQDFTYINSMERNFQGSCNPKTTIINPNKAGLYEDSFFCAKGSILRRTSYFKKN